MDFSIFVKPVLISLALSLFILVPLGWKWELPKKLTWPAIIFIGLLTGVIVGLVQYNYPLSSLFMIVLAIALIGVLSIGMILWRFFRDPDRMPPAGDHNIVSAADGTVIYVKRIENGEVPVSDKKGTKFKLEEFTQTNVLPNGGYLVGIAMSFLDVHINRAPMDGKITLLKHISGLFLSLKLQEALLTNERALVVIDNGRFKIGLVQIASRLVRKIVAFKKEGAEIPKGERIGMIKFGSQVDMVIPDLPGIKITTKVGDYVYAGESIVAQLDQ